MSLVADELAGTETERRCLAELRAASGETDGVMERHCVRCFPDGFYPGLAKVVWPVLRTRLATLPKVFRG